MKVWGIITASLLLASSAQAQDSGGGSLRFEPSSNWVMDYAEDSCALRRAFTAGDAHATVEFRQFGPGDALQIIVATDLRPRPTAVSRFAFTPNEDGLADTDAFTASYGDGLTGMIFSGSMRPGDSVRRTTAGKDWAEADRMAREQEITGLELTNAFVQDIFISTRAMHQPMEAMRACLDELVGHWGLDPEVQRTLSRPPKPVDLASWARKVRERYPANMVYRGHSGFVNVRIAVTPEGMPSSCATPGQMTNPAFGVTACDVLMKHARFEPALDAQGQPVESYFFTRVVYMVGR